MELTLSMQKMEKTDSPALVCSSGSMVYQLLGHHCMSHPDLDPGRSPDHSVSASPPTLPGWKLCAHDVSSDHPACCLPQAPDAAAICRPPGLPWEGSGSSCHRWVEHR